jgi:hypothetical protein
MSYGYVTRPLPMNPKSLGEVLAVFHERAENYARDMMGGKEGPYASAEECFAVLRQMCASSQVRVCVDSCKIIGRRSVVWEQASWTDGGWVEIPRNVAAELIRTGHLKRFQKERECDRVGWLEMGWDGDGADWYGWPA